ncbi:hypothetical protein [Kribbella sp. NBC_00889]|uniref:hypothetical protein n=1 Tax=Kribbella sp. NBC_00889 TaxID=2975974 RepID=UPI00386F3C3B|nr:hypothetical protein OG817_25230 [Kribbella sp. NBC_00889]
MKKSDQSSPAQRTKRATALLYEVTYTSREPDAPTRTVTDAAGVTELVRQAAAAGSRVHVRPLPDEDSDPATS